MGTMARVHVTPSGERHNEAVRVAVADSTYPPAT
jgi:hypothetical protein